MSSDEDAAPVAHDAQLAAPDGERITVGVVSDGYQIGRGKRSKQIVNVYDERFLDYIAALVRHRPKTGWDCNILLTGPRRAGKSTLGIQIGRKVDPRHFTIKQVAFRIEEFNSILKENPYADPENGIYPQAQLDEAGFDLFSQNWMETVQRNIVRRFEVIGAKRQTVELVLPHRMLLNRSFREGMVHYWINVRAFEGMRGFAEFREGVENVWKLDMFWKPICAFTFKSIDDDFWRAYVKKKEAFIEEVCGETLFQPERQHTKELIGQRNRAISQAWRTGHYTQEALASETGLAQSTIAEVVRGIKKEEV